MGIIPQISWKWRKNRGGGVRVRRNFVKAEQRGSSPVE